MSNDAGTRKRQLRRDLRRRLGDLDEAVRQRAAVALAERVLSMPEVASAEGVFTCLSFGVEIDTGPLVDQLVASGRDLWVPRADFATGRLHVHAYPCELETLSFGLQQPRAGQPELAAEAIDDALDVALVAGLAFDHGGFRLGHGGGFFDRFLASPSAAGRPFAAVGLAYDLQVVETLPTETHDMPLEAVATELRLIRAG